MRVRWTPQAEEDRIAIWEYIAEDNPPAAARMDALFSEAAGQLAHFPEMGRPGRIAGTRELVPHEHYLLVYQIADETTWILTLVHTARQWPPLG
ncbi:type II toxin-antitoxin system RelE/ParE family toxin [Endothiovibrio diazotrophicus]